MSKNLSKQLQQQQQRLKKPSMETGRTSLHSPQYKLSNELQNGTTGVFQFPTTHTLPGEPNKQTQPFSSSIYSFEFMGFVEGYKKHEK
jgi:hypothetical protein